MAKQSAVTPVTETNKDMTTVNEQALAKDLDNMRGDLVNMVRVRRELLKVPRIKLAQKSSAAFASRFAELGDFFCEVRSINWGKTVEIIPVLVNESASFLDVKTSQVICSTNDLMRSVEGKLCTQCPYGEYWNDWGSREKIKIPGCKHSINIVCLVANDEEVKPMEINFRKNNSKAGKELVNFIANDPRGLPFATAYKLASKEGKSKDYDYHYISKSIEKRHLGPNEIQTILPTVKRVIEMDKSGALERELDDDGRYAGDDIPV